MFRTLDSRPKINEEFLKDFKQRSGMIRFLDWWKSQLLEREDTSWKVVVVILGRDDGNENKGFNCMLEN